MSKLTVGSLFAGIGGFDLGFERAGMQTVWQVEIDEYASRVLAKHWPDAVRYSDIRSANPGYADVICGGFPCQDISVAGRGVGIDGERSGLWREFARIVGQVRPRYVVVENSPMLRSRGLGRVIGDLATLGYDAEWDCIPASAVGAPHQRDRLFVIAYPNGMRKLQPQGVEQDKRGRIGNSRSTDATNLGCIRLEAGSLPSGPYAEVTQFTGEGWWATEPNVVRMVHGVPNRVDRIRCLGNAVVPQVAEWIGRRIVEHDEDHRLLVRPQERSTEV